MNRRRFLSTTAAGLIAGAVTPAFATRALAQDGRKTLVLVHGAWHGAWCWSPVTERLAEMGFNVVAIDLPGHGVDAEFPAGYLSQPQDLAGLATAPSPLSALTLEDYRAHVTEIIQGLVDAGSGPVTLVGHSLGGVTLHAVAEANPELVGRLVYLTALAPIAKPAAGAYFGDPEMATSKALPLFIGDPAVTGAVRFNHLSVDPTFGAASKAAFYADVTDGQFAAVVNLLTPDEPAAVFGAEATVTAERWGAVPRTYIRCTDDQAIPVAAQDLFIAEADALTPGNPYEVRSLASSHSAFISVPDELAALLAEAAA